MTIAALTESHPISPRVPGLPIGDCAGSSNNLVPKGFKLSSIDVTEKALFERLYLILGLSSFEPRVNCPYAPTTPTIQINTVSRFLCTWPLIFW